MAAVRYDDKKILSILGTTKLITVFVAKCHYSTPQAS
jgi:hypothetical protein